MEVALKLARNMKSLGAKCDVREFFFVRYKRQLFKKKLIENVSKRIHKHLIDTELRLRAFKSNFLVKICFII